mmetsp:Transcript_41435/g.39874  ORF Transcript_41435/g.39874 Transcript_41435/m.39874 type:complete len:223 (-) Transcript_41435:5-673(-)
MILDLGDLPLRLFQPYDVSELLLGVGGAHSVLATFLLLFLGLSLFHFQGFLLAVLVVDFLEEVLGEVLLRADGEVGVLLGLGVGDEAAPVLVPFEGGAIAHHPQEVLGPGDGHIHPPEVTEEPNVLVLGGPHAGNYDDVLLSALVGVHCVDFEQPDCLPLRSEAGVELIFQGLHLRLVGRDDSNAPIQLIQHPRLILFLAPKVPHQVLNEEPHKPRLRIVHL